MDCNPPLSMNCLVLFLSIHTEDNVRPSGVNIYEADLQLRWASLLEAEEMLGRMLSLLRLSQLL